MIRVYQKGMDEDWDLTELVGSDETLLSKNKNMKSGLLKLSKENLFSALVYGLLAIALVVISQGTVFGLNWKALVDVGIIGLLTSLVKNLLTTDKGNFLGSVKVIPPTE